MNAKILLAGISVPKESFSSTGLSGRCLKISKWISFTYSPVTSQTAAFVQGARISESTCESLKRSNSDPHTSLGPLDICLLLFKARLFGALFLWSQEWGAHCWTQTPHSFKRSSACRRTLLIVRHSKGMRFLARPHLCLFYPFQCDTLSFVVEGAVQLVFSSFLAGIFYM